MALAKKDKEDIGQKVEVKITKEFGSLRLEMNQRFDTTGQKIDSAETQITNKLDELKQIILRRRAEYRTGS